MDSSVALADLRAVLAIVETGSFTRAAARLRMDRSLLSRRIRAVESALGAPLFARTTRVVRTTAEGDAFARKVAPLVAGFDTLFADRAEREVASGTVTLATTPELARDLIAPALATLRQRYPLVRLVLALSHGLVDLVRDHVDIALRVGKPGASSLVARKVGALEAGFFASPAYLQRRGTPTALAQLVDHDRLWPSVVPGQRSFAPDKRPPPPTIECADFGTLAELARLGAGIALLPAFVAARDLATGALQRVLPEQSLAGAPLYLVTRQRSLPLRVSAVRDHLRAHLRA